MHLENSKCKSLLYIFVFRSSSLDYFIISLFREIITIFGLQLFYSSLHLRISWISAWNGFFRLAAISFSNNAEKLCHFSVLFSCTPLAVISVFRYLLRTSDVPADFLCVHFAFSVFDLYTLSAEIFVCISWNFCFVVFSFQWHERCCYTTVFRIISFVLFFNCFLSIYFDSGII